MPTSVLASCGERGLHTWKVKSDTVRESKTLHVQSDVRCFTFGNSGAVLAVGRGDGCIEVRDGMRGAIIAKLEVPDGGGSVNTLDYAGSSDKLLSSGHGDNCLRIWNVQSRKIVREFHAKCPVKCSGLRKGDDYVAYGNLNEIRIMSLTSGTKIASLSVGATETTDLEWSPFRRGIIAAVDGHGELRVWDINRSRDILMHWNTHTAPATNVKFSPVNQLLFGTSSLDKTVRYYDVRVKKSIKALKTDAPIRSFDFHSSGYRIAVATAEGNLAIYDLRAGKDVPTQKFYAKDQLVRKVAFRPSPRDLDLSSASRQTASPSEQRNQLSSAPDPSLDANSSTLFSPPKTPLRRQLVPESTSTVHAIDDASVLIPGGRVNSMVASALAETSLSVLNQRAGEQETTQYINSPVKTDLKEDENVSVPPLVKRYPILNRSRKEGSTPDNSVFHHKADGSGAPSAFRSEENRDQDSLKYETDGSCKSSGRNVPPGSQRDSKSHPHSSSVSNGVHRIDISKSEMAKELTRRRAEVEILAGANSEASNVIIPGDRSSRELQKFQAETTEPEFPIEKIKGHVSEHVRPTLGSSAKLDLKASDPAEKRMHQSPHDGSNTRRRTSGSIDPGKRAASATTLESGASILLPRGPFNKRVDGSKSKIGGGADVSLESRKQEYSPSVLGDSMEGSLVLPDPVEADVNGEDNSYQVLATDGLASMKLSGTVSAKNEESSLLPTSGSAPRSNPSKRTERELSPENGNQSFLTGLASEAQLHATESSVYEGNSKKAACVHFLRNEIAGTGAQQPSSPIGCVLAKQEQLDALSYMEHKEQRVLSKRVELGARGIAGASESKVIHSASEDVKRLSTETSNSPARKPKVVARTTVDVGALQTPVEHVRFDDCRQSDFKNERATKFLDGSGASHWNEQAISRSIQLAVTSAIADAKNDVRNLHIDLLRGFYESQSETERLIGQQNEMNRKLWEELEALRDENRALRARYHV